MDDEHEFDPQAHAAAHIEWLKTVSPDDWHRTVLAFQWAEDFDPLLWMVQQDDCDRATAVTIFWRLSPEIAEAEDVCAGRFEGYLSDNEIAEYIANRLNREGYRRAEIAFDAEPMMLGDYEGFKSELRDVKNPLWHPHPDMIRSIAGREVTLAQDGFMERYPEQLGGGSFIELPPSDIITPDMNVARAETRIILFNLAGIGVAIGLILLVDWSSSRAIWLGCIGVVGGLWSILSVRSSAAIVRSVLRQDYAKPSKLSQTIAAAACIGLGVLISVLLLKFHLVSAFSAWSGLGSMTVRILGASAVIAGWWVIAGPIAKYLIYRKAFP